MNITCNNWNALHFRAEELKKPPKISPCFAESCDSGTISLSTIGDQPGTLKNFLVDSTPRSREFRNIIRAYHSSLATGCVKGVWISSGSGASTFILTVSLHNRIYYCLHAMVLLSLYLISFFLFIYMTETIL